jgi:ferritin-like metal-binding protein YciE
VRETIDFTKVAPMPLHTWPAFSEGEEITDDFKGQPAIDPGLASAAQAVEHYDIARYGTLARWAGDLGLKDAKPLLITLNEKEATDKA